MVCVMFFIVILIISGMGFEVISFFVIINKEKVIKYLLIIDVILLDEVILDVDLVKFVLLVIIVDIGMDVLMYVFEVYVFIKVNDYLDVMVEKVI